MKIVYIYFRLQFFIAVLDENRNYNVKAMQLSSLNYFFKYIHNPPSNQKKKKEKLVIDNKL